MVDDAKSNHTKAGKLNPTHQKKKPILLHSFFFREENGRPPYRDYNRWRRTDCQRSVMLGLQVNSESLQHFQKSVLMTVKMVLQSCDQI